MTIVLDASAAVELLLQTPLGEAVAATIRDLHGPLHAPSLLDLEVIQVLGRLERTRTSKPELIAAAARRLWEMPVQKHQHEPLLGRIWQLRRNLTAYDACYLALAEALDAPLVTCDAGLCLAARKAKSRGRTTLVATSLR
jgi:predicted nucleic acid-binding protein